MYGTDMVAGKPNFPEPHLCFEVPAAQSLYLFRAVRLCCSAGQLAPLLPEGLRTPLLTEKFFCFFFSPLQEL